MVIYHAVGLVDQVPPKPVSLKSRLQAVGAGTLRRAGRFNQLAVLGAASCADGLTLPHACDVIIASVASNVSDTVTVLGDAILRHQSPMPFAFINTQGNSACYNVANVLELEGNSLFISHPDAPLESALRLARVRSHFSSAKLLMLGVVDEWTLPYYQPPTGYCDGDQQVAYEGSCWFVIGEAWPQGDPLARIIAVDQALTLQQLQQQLGRVDLVQGVQWDLCSRAQSSIALAADVKAGDVPEYYTQLHENLAVISWLQQEQSRYYCRIRANRMGGFRWLLIERSM